MDTEYWMLLFCFQGLTNVAIVSASIGQKNFATDMTEKAGIKISQIVSQLSVAQSQPSSSVDKREGSTEIL